jgi:hypothetical protein
MRTTGTKEKVMTINKVFYVGRENIAHIFTTEDAIRQFPESAEKWDTLSAWLDDDETFICVNWCGEIEKESRPLDVDSHGRIGVTVRPNSKDIEIRLAGQHPATPFTVGYFTPDEVEKLCGARVELVNPRPNGDMYRNGVGRYADHR